MGSFRRQVGVHLRPLMRGRIIKSVGFGPSRTLGEQEPSAECVQPNFGKRPLAGFASKSRGRRHHLQIKRIRAAVTTCRTGHSDSRTPGLPKATPLPSAAHAHPRYSHSTHRCCQTPRSATRRLQILADVWAGRGAAPQHDGALLSICRHSSNASANYPPT